MRCLGVCIAGSSDDVYLSLGMRSLMLGLDSVASRRSLARWAFLRLVSGEGGGACSTAVQRSSQYSCRFCRSFSMSGRRVKYGLADTPTTVGAPSGTREEHLVSTPPSSTAPATLSFCTTSKAAAAATAHPHPCPRPPAPTAAPRSVETPQCTPRTMQDSRRDQTDGKRAARARRPTGN